MLRSGGIGQPAGTSREEEQQLGLAADHFPNGRGAATQGSAVRCSLIIVTKCRPELLRRSLECSLQALPEDGEVIVVDGDLEHSAAGVVGELRARHQARELRYIASKPGTTRQRNVGIDAARGEIVVLVDDDCTFGPGLLESLLSAYEDRSWWVRPAMCKGRRAGVSAVTPTPGCAGWSWAAVARAR